MEKNLLDKPKIRIKTGGLQGASETGRQDGLEVFAFKLMNFIFIQLL